MFKGVRDERERFLRETESQLSALEQAGGTRTYQGESPDVNVPCQTLTLIQEVGIHHKILKTGTEYVLLMVKYMCIQKEMDG